MNALAVERVICVSVTEADIKRGRYSDGLSCPVALAMRRALADVPNPRHPDRKRGIIPLVNYRGGAGWWILTELDERCDRSLRQAIFEERKHPLPEAVGNWMQLRDIMRQPMWPIDFDLELPDRIQL